MLICCAVCGDKLLKILCIFGQPISFVVISWDCAEMIVIKFYSINKSYIAEIIQLRRIVDRNNILSSSENLFKT